MHVIQRVALLWVCRDVKHQRVCVDTEMRPFAIAMGAISEEAAWWPQRKDARWR